MGATPTFHDGCSSVGKVAQWRQGVMGATPTFHATVASSELRERERERSMVAPSEIRYIYAVIER